MRKKILYWLAALTLTVFSAPPATVAQDTAKDAALPNFHQVNERLFRGAQPKSGGWQKLSARGVKTVINLRDDDARALAEEAEVRAAGLHYFNVPFGRLGRPSDADVERVLALINAPENQPVFVHCTHGADRTGTVIAVYRIAHDNWTSEQAKAEAKRYGLKPWERGMKDYIHDYDKRRTPPPAQPSTPATIPVVPFIKAP